MIYYVICYSMLAFCVIEFLLKMWRVRINNVDDILYKIFSLFLLVIAAIRDHVGLDYASYEMLYQGLKNSSGSLLNKIFDLTYEPLFQLLNLISPSFRFLIIVCVGLGVLTKLLYINKNIEFKLFCLFLYYCSMFLYYDMGIFRQGISASFVFFSLQYIKRQDLKRFLAVIFVGTLFHITAILTIPLYFMGEKRYNRKTFILAIAIAYGIGNATNMIFNILSGFRVEYIAHKFAAYTTYFSIETDLALTYIKRLIVLLVIVESYRHYVKIETEQEDEMGWIYINGYFLSIVELMVFAAIPILATRGTAGLYFTHIFLLSNIVFDKRIGSVVKVGVFLIAIAFALNTMYNTLLNSVGNLYIPYTTMWD